MNTDSIDRLVKFANSHDLCTGVSTVAAVSIDRTELLCVSAVVAPSGDVTLESEWVDASWRSLRDWLGY